MMRWTDDYPGASGWMLLCGLVFAAVLLACAVALVRLTRVDRDRGSMSEAERELRLRLARGEIGIDEFLKQEAALRR